MNSWIKEAFTIALSIFIFMGAAPAAWSFVDTSKISTAYESESAMLKGSEPNAVSQADYEPEAVIVGMKEYTEWLSGLHIVEVIDINETLRSRMLESEKENIPHETVFAIKLRETNAEKVQESINILSKRDDVERIELNNILNPGEPSTEYAQEHIPGEILYG